MTQTLVLDLDGSVLPLEGAETIALRAHEEELRFACSLDALARVPECEAKLVFMGSGDFHHLTCELISRRQQRMEVVVLDNHPDNMRYPFGIHCGSWVSHVAKLPFVTRVHVAGITSGDVEGAHALENRVRFLRSGKVVYWCIRKNLSALRRLGVRASRSFDSTAEMLDALRGAMSGDPVYLSIDKDVLANDVVQTNWDQGVMQLDELESLIATIRGNVLAADVTGDVSTYRYRSRFKRMLSALDRQPAIPPSSLAAWREAHRRLNLRLCSLLG